MPGPFEREAVLFQRILKKKDQLALGAFTLIKLLRTISEEIKHE